MNYEWISMDDALSKEHKLACHTLDRLIGSNDFRKSLCRGDIAFGFDDDLCLFEHNGDQLSPQSTVEISSIGEFMTKMSLAELYYYIHLAYQRLVEDGQPQDILSEFAAGLEYFRNTCKIKCDANGNPILETTDPGCLRTVINASDLDQ